MDSTSLGIGAVIGIIIGAAIFMALPQGGAVTGNIISQGVEDAYSKFTCTACGGKSIAESGSLTALGMREYIQQLSATGLSGDGLVVEAAKRFGLTYITDDETAKMVIASFNSTPDGDRPVMYVSPMEVNLGDTTQAAGVIMTSFTVRNDGKSDLVISNLKTSCDCMYASFIVGGHEGPRIGRFSQVGGWSVIMAPGEEALLWLYYDPRVNGWFTGKATRWVFITSNDPVKPIVQIKVEHNQIDTLMID
jgi:hypothetical protein